ncbi:hypothetical protein [Chloroflexus sp.]|uniref:hypothetical protein n=1 Tax=Chloroflexus sp. TaxID=1904827 RepID=UPI003C786920
MGVAVLVAMGFNWLRVNNLLPVTQMVSREEGFRGRERGEFVFGGEQGGREFVGRSEHHIDEVPSLAHITDMGEVLIKIVVITIIVVLIDRINRFVKRRRRPVEATP